MSNTLNFVVWAESCEDGNVVANKLTGKTNSCDGCFATATVGSNTVNVYLRGPGCTQTSAPQNGVTDVLVVYLNTKEHLEFASEYVAQRSGIPTKVALSSNDLSSWASERGLTYQNELSDDFFSKLISTAQGVNDTLVNTFKLFDKNNNGTISVDELITVSKELGHTLNSEEALEISSTISSGSEITFDRFKHWWFLGRSNFNQFRSLVQMEMKMNDLIKQNSKHIGGYLETLSKSVVDVNDVGLVSRISILPKVDFENGVGMTLNYGIGKQGKELLSGLPSYFSSNPVTYSLELQIDNADKGSEVVAQLEGIRDMVFSMVPGLGESEAMGVSVKFRHVGQNVYIDITLGGGIGDMVNSQIGQFSGSIGSGVNGYGSSQMFLGLKLNGLLENSFEELVRMVTKFKVQGHGEVSSFKHIIEMASNMIQLTNKSNSVKVGLSVFKLLSCLKSFEYNSTYDSEELANLAMELAGKIAHKEMGQAQMNELNSEIGCQILGGVVAQVQDTGKMQLEGVKAMAGMFLGPYLDAISVLNFDKIGIAFALPSFSIHYKVSLSLTGLTEFLRTNILS